MTKIIHCRVENILGAKEIEFEPNGNGVTIGGPNGQGKSSAIRALAMALGGKSLMPAEPVHKGADSGNIAIKLDKFNVELEVASDRTTKLRVSTADGAKYASPQELLNKLFGNLAFDPGQFKLLPREKRLLTLQKLTGLDLSELELKRDSLREKRKAASSRLRDLKGAIESRPILAGVPEEEESIAACLADVEHAIAQNQQRLDLDAKIGSLISQEEKLRASLRDINERIAKLTTEHSQTLVAINQVAQQQLDCAEEKFRIPQKDVDHFRAKLSEIEETNKRVRANMEARELQKRHSDGITYIDETERAIEALETERLAKISAAPFPIENLSFSGDDVTYNGVPFEQISESEQWEVSTAIGFALNKDGIVFMSNCGGLDKNSRDRVRARAAALGVQLFLEVVDDNSDVQVVIEEGTVKENRLAAPTERTGAAA